MSWTVQFIGNPKKIVDALKVKSDELTGASKEEFDAAMPHIIGLVGLNYNIHSEPVIDISASGHGHGGYNTCSVTIKALGGILV